MKLLIIGTDTKLFDKNSEVRNRSLCFSESFEEYAVIVASSRVRCKSEFSIGLNKNVNFIAVFSKIKLFLFFKTLFVAFKYAKKSDLISSQDIKFIGAISLFVSILRKKKLHIQIHTVPTINVFTRFILRRAYGIRVVSESIRSKLEKIVPGKKINVLPVFIDTKKYSDAVPDNTIRSIIPETDFVILAMSRLEPEKRVEEILKAFSLITKKNPKVSLIIVGEGNKKKAIESLIRELGLVRVRILPWTNTPERYYKAADLFITLSKYEGYGMTIVESLIAGCPVLTTKVGVSSDFIKNGYNSWVVESAKEEQVSLLLGEIISNKDYYLKVKKNIKQDLFLLFPSFEEYKENIYKTFL